MLLRTRRNRLPRGYRRQRQARNGPPKAKWGRRLASTQKHHRRPLLPRVYRLLPILRPQLLQSRPTPPRFDQKALSLALGRTPTQSLRNLENPYVPEANPCPTRLRATVLLTNRRFGLWDRSRALP